MNRFLVLLTIVASLFSFSINANDLDAIVKSGKLRVAVDTTYPPMEFQADDGKIIGLDVDLAREIAKVLKVDVDFIVMPWDGILAGLQSNRYDIIMSSMNVTDERKLQVNFVPYIMMGQVFVVKKKALPLKNEKDLKGLVIAVQADTTSFTAVEAFQKSGIAIKEIKAFKGATETFSALKSNQADVIVIDEAVGLYYAGLDQKSFQVSGQAMKPEPIGIAVKKTDTKLLKAIETAMKTIKDNGAFAKVYKQWLKKDPIK
ncbi:MAG: amino acid ABC transporter substrate-binding protein [Bacteriovorax sp.]|nr:amino acid ABC transporter substrate-binding protein [Bacteriovorax sp.]